MGAFQYLFAPCRNPSAFHQIVQRLNMGTVSEFDAPIGKLVVEKRANGHVDQRAKVP